MGENYNLDGSLNKENIGQYHIVVKKGLGDIGVIIGCSESRICADCGAATITTTTTVNVVAVLQAALDALQQALAAVNAALAQLNGRRRRSATTCDAFSADAEMLDKITDNIDDSGSNLDISEVNVLTSKLEATIQQKNQLSCDVNQKSGLLVVALHYEDKIEQLKHMLKYG